MASNSELTKKFIDEIVNEKIIGFNGENNCTAEETKSRVDKWRKLGSYVVANSGGYDALGLNHLRGLMQARIIAATHKLGNDAKNSDIQDLAISDEIKLLVSLDTNRAIEDNKSFKNTEAYSVRPLLDWDTRAITLALLGIAERHQLVDFVTRHGPQACTICKSESCIHSSKTYNVASSGADLVIIKQLDTATSSRYPESNFHVIDESDGAFYDRLLANQISTSALIRRIRTEKYNS